MITVNGKELSISDMTVSELLANEGYGAERVAVELNYEIVPRAKYGKTVVKDGDTVEIVRFVGGG